MRAEVDNHKKRQAIMKMLGCRKLHRLGDSYAIILPKLWIDANAVKMGESYYVKMSTEMEEIIVQPIDQGEINQLLEANDV